MENDTFGRPVDGAPKQPPAVSGARSQSPTKEARDRDELIGQRTEASTKLSILCEMSIDVWIGIFGDDLTGCDVNHPAPATDDQQQRRVLGETNGEKMADGFLGHKRPRFWCRSILQTSDSLANLVSHFELRILV